METVNDKLPFLMLLAGMNRPPDSVTFCARFCPGDSLPPGDTHTVFTTVAASSRDMAERRFWAEATPVKTSARTNSAEMLTSRRSSGNTDFADTEVDFEPFNLTPFKVFIPEKRQFFLENGSSISISATRINCSLAARLGLILSPVNRCPSMAEPN